MIFDLFLSFPFNSCIPIAVVPLREIHPREKTAGSVSGTSVPSNCDDLL
jgi:hypothetical protein